MNLSNILVCALLVSTLSASDVSAVIETGAATSTRLPVEGDFPSLDGAVEWINSPRLAAAELRGKVVLVDFWTFSCINWLRTLPYVRAWAEKYRSQGLVVIGVHTPEFEFEKAIVNVRRASKGMDVSYPVAIDSDYTIWNAFNNQYWPALYFVDAQGHIRHHQFGEGDYAKSERVIQDLLKEAGATDVARDLVTVKPQGLELAADWAHLDSPETYVGYERSERLASAGGVLKDKPRAYTAPRALRLNQWSLTGDWTIGGQSAVLNAKGGRISYRFRARDLNLVMGASTASAPVRFRVLIDGKPPLDNHGVDVDGQGNGTLDQHRVYQLIRQNATIVERDFEIEFPAPGVEIYSFTFG